MKTICLLFDLDGTLVLTGGAGLRSFNQAFFEIFKTEKTLESIKPAGKTDTAIIKEVCRLTLKRDPTLEEMEQCFDRYLNLLKIEVDSPNFQILPGVKPLLKSLSQHSCCLLGLGTGNLEKGAEIKLKHSNLWDYFQFGGFGSDSEDRPELLRIAQNRALKLLKNNETIDQTWVIGDTPKDIQAGKAIRANTVGVATGPYSSDQLIAEGADLVYEDLQDYKAFIKDVGLA